MGSRYSLFFVILFLPAFISVGTTAQPKKLKVPERVFIPIGYCLADRCSLFILVLNAFRLLIYDCKILTFPIPITTMFQ